MARRCRCDVLWRGGVARESCGYLVLLSGAFIIVNVRCFIFRRRANYELSASRDSRAPLPSWAAPRNFDLCSASIPISTVYCSLNRNTCAILRHNYRNKCWLLANSCLVTSKLCIRSEEKSSRSFDLRAGRFSCTLRPILFLSFCLDVDSLGQSETRQAGVQGAAMRSSGRRCLAL